jgi:hypothetical protein
VQLPEEQVDETTETDETDDEGTESDQEATETTQAEWTPPSEADYKKLQGIADKRRAERDRYRRDLAALRKAVKATDGEEASGTGADTAQSDKWRGVAVKKAATAALKEAGFNGDAKALKRLISTIDLSQVEPDDDGDIDIDEQIDDLKGELPALFGARQRPGAPRVSTGHGRDTDAPAKDVTAEHSLRLLRMGASRR